MCNHEFPTCVPTMAIRDSQKPSAAQADFLMRAYRESFQRKDGRRGLTQDDLLRLMAEVDVDGEYGERYSHATVSRCETGQTSPSVERFRTFGKALELSDNEVAGLILLSVWRRTTLPLLARPPGKLTHRAFDARRPASRRQVLSVRIGSRVKQFCDLLHLGTMCSGSCY